MRAHNKKEIIRIAKAENLYRPLMDKEIKEKKREQLKQGDKID